MGKWRNQDARWLVRFETIYFPLPQVEPPKEVEESDKVVAICAKDVSELQLRDKETRFIAEFGGDVGPTSERDINKLMEILRRRSLAGWQVVPDEVFSVVLEDYRL